MSWFKETVGREVKNKIKNKHPVAHEKIIIEIFVFINVLENNINKIYSFLLLRYFFQNLLPFQFKKESRKTQIIYFCVFYGSSGLKKKAIYDF